MRQAARRLRESIGSKHPDVSRIFFGAEALSEEGDISRGHDGVAAD